MGFPTASHMKLELRMYGPDEQRASCLFYYVLESGTDPEVGTMAAHVEFFYDLFAPKVAAIMTAGTGVLQMIGTWKFGSTYLDAVSTGIPVAGTISEEDILPEEDSIVLQKRTNLQGRQHRGRWFFPYIPESLQQDGELVSAAYTGLNPLCEFLRTQQVNAVYEPASTWNPVHANSKDGVFERIHDVRIVRQVCNKRSRRSPKRLDVVGVAFS